MYSRNTKTTNEPTASNNKSDRPQVNIWDTWKTLKYLNINDSFHLKNLEISKYKRESKGRWSIQIYRFIFVNCCLIWFLKCKNICHAIYFFNNTIIVQVRYIIIETKEFVRIGYNGFLFPHSYPGDGLGATHLGLHPSIHSCGKRNRLYPIRAASFVSTVLYLIHVWNCWPFKGGTKKLYSLDLVRWW